MKRANWLTVPEAFNLNAACLMVTEAFGYHLYLVGSCLDKRDWRDVDLRCMLPDEEFDALFPGSERNYQLNAKWNLICMAISTWLRERTNLPIDFQIQRQSWANEEFPCHVPEHPHTRSAIGFFLHERAKEQFPAITFRTEPMDLTGHGPDCELWQITHAICTADAMDPNRKVMFTCTCGYAARERGAKKETR